MARAAVTSVKALSTGLRAAMRAIAASLQAFPLPDAVEPAPVFEPGR